MRSVCAHTIAVGVIVGHLLVSPALAENRTFSEPKIGVAFDQELFELAYTVFLANSNLTEALAVTEAALKAKPTDKVWRAKGAQTAEWAGRPDLALQHWFFLAQQGDRNAAQAALRISRSLNELPLRKQLLERVVVESAGMELQKEYLSVVESLGLPEEAYALLSSGRMRVTDPVWRLTEQARIAEALGRTDDAVAAWEKRAALKPLNPDESMKLATLWYGQGNTAQAFYVLRQASRTTPERATAFWRTYSDLAWTLQEIPEAITGAELLIRSGAATESDYQRIQTTFQESDPARVYLIARAGWQRFPKPLWWYAMVESGLRCGRARELLSFYNSLTPDEHRLLSVDGRSWSYLAQVYRQNGDRDSSLLAARTAVQREKNNVDLFSGYLWLLVDLKQVEELRSLVMEWETRLGANPELREPLAAAMMLMGEPARALPIYRLLARSRQSDAVWLVSYGDVLEQAGYAETAWQVRYSAQKLVAARIRSEAGSAEAKRRDLVTQAQLMMQLSPGDSLTTLIGRVTDKNDDLSRELVMGWAMTTGQADMARFWYWRNFARAVERPEWVRLGLALEENDRSGIADLIEAHPERLPFRDAVEGAQRTGMTHSAESLAFEHLLINPYDHQLDQRMREFASANPGVVSYSLTLEDQAGVGWLQNKLTLSQPYNGRYALKTEMTERHFTLLKHDAIGAMPRYDLDGRLTATRRHERGYLALSLGMRDGGFNSFVTSALEGQWQPHRDLNLAVRADYNGRGEESAPLSVAGARDRLRLSATGTLSPRDTLALELASMNYHDQHRNYLGEGMTVNLDLRHQITGAWPDYGMRGYGGYTATSAGGTLTAEAAALVPVNAVPSASFYVPGSFGQVGVGVFVGQAWKSVYTRDWKPFAEADIGWTTNAGVGFSYGVGVVSPLFGSDQLKLELHQSSGQYGLTGLTSSINLDYRYLY